MFTPATLGPVTLRNRVIKAATFGASSPNALVTDDFITCHRLPAAGGALLVTTVAYLAVSKGGRTEGNVIWWRREAIPELKKLTETIHAEGAAISAQIDHAGPVANARSTKATAMHRSRNSRRVQASVAVGYSDDRQKGFCCGTPNCSVPNSRCR